MKSIVKLSAVIFASLFLTGCGGKEVVTECVRTGTIQEGVEVSFNYKVSSKNDYVLKVETVEKVISDDKDYLNAFKENVEKMYAPYKDIEEYKYEVTVDGNTLISKTDINYEKIDMDKLIEVDSANSQIIKNGKIKLSDVTNLYNSVGATCSTKE